MEGFCRGCLTSYDEPTELLQYTEKNRRLFVYSTGIQVKRNDVITFQLCKYCFVSMKAASNFKKLCRSSDKKLKSYFSLKDAGVSIDFSTFLKNSDDSTLFRLPLVSGSSTPANKNKAKEDDNESTCTSIRNFMKDILQGEEMVDTEDHIIREVIEEEADLLDDTLDSHWFHDETSIDNDFPLDLSFSPFATPYTVNNDHRYTPKREDQSQVRKYFTSVSPIIHHRTMDVITDLIKNNQSEKELCSIQNDSENEQAVNNSSIYAVGEQKFDLNLSANNDDKEILDFNLPTIKEEKPILDISIDSESLMNSLNLPIDDSDIDTNNAELQSFDSLPSIPSIKNESISNLDLPVVDNINKDVIINPPKFYVNNDCTDYINTSEEIEKIVDSKLSYKNDKKKLCPIDNNLDRALKDENATEYSLDGLLVSPQVGSTVSTPTINNILFGEIVISNKSIKSEENVEHFEILDEFFQTDSKASKSEIKDLEEESEIVDKEDIEVKEVKKIDNTPAYDQSQFDLENCICNICQKNYHSVKSLCIHSAKKHNIKIIKPRDTAYISKPRLCQLCGQEFRNLQNYHRHLKRHEKRPEPRSVYKCDHCSLEFSSIYTLQRHKASHDPKPIEKEPGKYVCTICGVTSNTIGNMRLHQRRHEKNYKCKCEECGKKFYTQSELTVHIRNHTGEKPFPCIHCERRFSRKDALVKHVKIHISDSPFGCEYCNHKFRTNTQLKVHIRKSIRCKRKRGILDTDTLMENVKSEVMGEETIVKTQVIPKLEPMEIVTNEVEVDEENIVKIEEIPTLATVDQLPYIDTEFSN